MVSQVEDAQDCFNVNNLLTVEQAAKDQATSAIPEKSRKQQTVEQLLADAGLDQITAEQVYQQLVDYLDGDSTTAKGKPRRVMPGQVCSPRGFRPTR